MPEAEQAQQPPASQAEAIPSHKPIWEVIEEENRSIPPEVWDTLPADLSEQHDHYMDVGKDSGKKPNSVNLLTNDL